MLGAGMHREAAANSVGWTAASGASLPAGDIVTFFYLANRTGAHVRVRVWADGREIFSRTLPATPPPRSGVLPPPPPYPVAELKIAVPRSARTLVVGEEMTLKMKRSFIIAGFHQREGGFRITLTRAGIVVSQDYQPIR